MTKYNQIKIYYYLLIMSSLLFVFCFAILPLANSYFVYGFLFVLYWYNFGGKIAEVFSAIKKLKKYDYQLRENILKELINFNISTWDKNYSIINYYKYDSFFIKNNLFIIY